MRLNILGEKVDYEWNKSIELRPDMNLILDEYVIMPNHFHGIIIIGDNKYNTNQIANDFQIANKFGPQSKNLASILRGFKSAVTTFARKNGNSNFEWQARYHDHIIRNNHSFLRIKKYILNNPLKWKNDRFY